MHTGHTLADTAGFSRALRALSQPAHPDIRKLATCNARLKHALDGALQHARRLRDEGHFQQARQALEAVDARYGGLAAPASVELLRTLDADDAARR